MVLVVLCPRAPKVSKTGKIRNRYNQVPHLTRDTTWESDKTQFSITNKSQEDSPFPAGDHNIATNRRESMTNTGHKHGLQSLPPSPKRAERKGRRRPFREAGSGHKQWNRVSCVDTFSIISKFSAQNSKSKNAMLRAIV